MNGQWTPQETPDGQLTNRSANVSYARFFDSSMDKWLSTQNTVSHDDGDCQIRRSTEVFLPNGNLRRLSNGGTSTKTTLFDSQNALRYGENGKYSTMTNFDFHFMRKEKLSHNYTSTSDTTSLLNELMEQSMDKNEHYHMKLANNVTFKHITDLLRSDFSVEFDKQLSRGFSLYDLHYEDAGVASDFRNNYRPYDSRHWYVKEKIGYDWNWSGWSLRPQYQYNYKYNKTNNALYRLDRLEGQDSLSYNTLPSSKDALLSVLDNNNSYYYTEYQNHHRLILEWEINAASGPNKLGIEYGYIRLPLRLVNKNLFYTRLGCHDVSEHAAFFEPEIFFRGGKSVVWVLSSSIKSEIPDLVKKVDYRDDSDPLFLVSGNPSLKNIHRYQASLSVHHEGGRQRLWNASLAYNKTDNDIAYATLYDMHTGISTLIPVSVNGNWRLDGRIGFSMPIDSARRWTFDNRLAARYNHNVDMTTTEGNAASMRSVVNNLQVADEAKVNFRPNERMEFSLHASGTYYYINSRRDGFNNTHAGDYKVGVNANLQLPWSISFDSDFTVYVRRGYQESMMNTTEWVWNANINRSFLKGALVAKLTGFDLLHQLSNTRYEMNEQGRTEVWYNSIPRYVMLSLVWKFNVSPKRN